MNKIKYIVLLVLCCCVSAAWAQKRISGHVWSKVDGPIMMANVVELDQNGRIVSATTTDINGNFSLNVKSANNTLRVTYVGYTTFSQKLGTNTVFKIELKDRRTLTEVEVIARKKEQVSGLNIPAREVSDPWYTDRFDMAYRDICQGCRSLLERLPPL